MRVDEVSRITCPMLCLVNTGEVAERIRQTRKMYASLSNPKSAFHLFTEEEGADAHNQANNLSLLHAIVFDLNRCQSYGQCVFAAPTVFRLHGEESFEYDYEPDEALRVQVERAAAACPVQAKHRSH